MSQVKLQNYILLLNKSLCTRFLLESRENQATSTYLYVAICKPNYLPGSSPQSNHQNCCWYSHKRCLCCFSYVRILRNYRNRPFRIDQTTTKSKNIRNDWWIKHNIVRLQHNILINTLTIEHTKQARRPRKSFGIVSNDIFIMGTLFLRWNKKISIVFMTEKCRFQAEAMEQMSTINVRN